MYRSADFAREFLAHYEIANDALLAKAPPALRNDRWNQTSRGWEDTRQQLEARLYALRNWRLSWWGHWAKLADAILPRRYHWLITPNTMARGQAINQAIKDPTATQALGVCQAGMREGQMSSSRPWFAIKAELSSFKPDKAAVQWFADVQERVYKVLNKSNYYQSGTTMFEDLIVFGTAPKLMYEDWQDVIRCYNPAQGEYFLGAGGDGRVNSFYRHYNQTVYQIVERFGLANCPQNVRDLWAQKGASLEVEFIVAHAIEPNFSLQSPGRGDARLGVVPGGFTYREYYWLWNRWSEQPLSVRGFHGKPFITPRWTVVSNDAYGRSVGMDALPDILQLHVMTMRQAEAVEKMVRPPLLADVSLKNQPASILPGKVTYTNDTSKGMRSIYDLRFDVEHMTALIEKIEARIDRWFFVDLFQMMANLEGVQPRNEMEIAERRGEKLQRLGPVVEGVERELADDVRRVVSIMERRRMLPPKPPSLHNVPLEIEFDSMIRVAQRAAQTAVMERTLNVVTAMKTSFPEDHPEDVVKIVPTTRKYLELSNFPPDLMNDDDEVAAIQATRTQAQQHALAQQQALTAATHAAPAVAKAAKDASQIDPGGMINAINLMTGSGGVGAGPGVPAVPQ